MSQRGSMTAVDSTVTSAGEVNSGSQSKTQQRSHGQASSRSARERKKERKTRSKTNLSNPRQQLPARQADANSRHTQDSESAYNTHEASDSYFDPTSSHDHDSNGHEIQHDHEHLNVHNSIKNKLRESQESDLPESHGSNSENESKVKLRNKVVKNGCDEKIGEKRISQSISSEDEETPGASGVQDSVGCDLDKIGKTAEEAKCSELDDPDKCTSQSLASAEQLNKLHLKSEFEGVSKFEHEPLVGVLNTVNEKLVKKENKVVSNSAKKHSPVTEGINYKEEVTQTYESSFVDVSFESTSPTFSGIEDLESTSNEMLLPEISETQISDQTVDSLADEISKNVKGLRNRKQPAVHFIPGNELVREREITPLCSRDSTPTHTQSEIILPTTNAATKRLRRVTTRSKSESDTETDEEEGSYQQMTIRRRKGRSQEMKESGSGSGRSSLLPPSTSRKSSTAASSSEGETEAHASECGRRVRYKKITFKLTFIYT